MPNDMTDRTSSEAAEQVTLRIPTATPTVTALLVVTLLLLFVGGTLDTLLLTRTGLQMNAIINELQLHRLLTGLVLLPFQPERMIISVLFALVSLYTLYIVGNSTERLWGNARFALVYGLAGVSGGVVTVLLAALGLLPTEAFYAAAPGAILAGLGAEFVYMTLHSNLYGQRGVQRRMYLGGLAALNVLLAAFVPQVDVFGTVAGLLGGAVFAWYVGPMHLPRQHPDDPNALLGEDVNPLSTRWTTVLLYFTVVLALLTAAFYIAV